MVTGRTDASEWLGALLVFAAFVVAACVVWAFWGRGVRAVLRRIGLQPDEALIAAPRRLMALGLVLLGAYYSAASLGPLHAHPRTAELLGRVLAIGWVALLLWTTLRLFNRAVDWRLRRVADDLEHFGSVRYRLNLLRKLTNVLAVGLAGLYALRIAGADISPLLASGAIGGLAVALAAQDTLSNLIAGFYLAIDRPIRVGDFIRLETGQEGYVEQIGWRNTMVRLFANNVVVIPNSKLSQAVVTNYYLPEPAMSVYVPCGVAYDSDLQHVEDVVLDVARQVERSVNGADPAWEPTVRWKGFGESAVDFVTALRVSQFEAQYLLQSEFVKALHARFRAEGIEIPFPMRTVIVRSVTDDGVSGDGRFGAPVMERRT